MQKNGMPSDFALIHNSAGVAGMRLSFIFDDQARGGPEMDAPDSIAIGCASKRQDLVNRGFDAEDAFIEVCLLQGFGRRAYMTPFEYECFTGRAAKATGGESCN